jgi:hypothetical protein
MSGPQQAWAGRGWCAAGPQCLRKEEQKIKKMVLVADADRHLDARGMFQLLGDN